MKRLRLGFGMAMLGVLSLASIALASSPPTFTGTIFDETGKLSGAEGRVDIATKDLLTTTKLGFHVAFLNALDGVAPSDFAEQTAQANGLKTEPNVLLIVSFSDRKDAVWSSPSTEVNQDELDTIRRTLVEPQLKAGDFAGAVMSAIDGFKRAQLGTLVNQPASQPQAQLPHFDIDGGAIFRGLAFVVAFVLAAIVVLYLLSEALKWQRKREAAQAEMRKMADLAKKAQSLLVKTDERIRSAKQDAEFAEAQYGEDEVKSYRVAIQSAEEDLQEAFKVGQQIDDDIPETYDERYQMFEHIVAATGRANKAIDTEEAKIDTLKSLEKDAVATLSKLIAGKGARAKALKDGQSVVDKLTLHGRSALESVEHNLAVAASFNELADKELDSAQKAVDGSNMAQAALHIREAQSGLARSKAALDGLAKVGDSLDAAERDLDSQITSAAADISAAAAAVRDSGMKALSGHLDVAKNRLEQARRESTKPDADYLVAYKAAVDAQGSADEVLQDIRTEQERAARALEQARQQIRLAKTSIDQADTYINSHRSRVGRKARNRLSEASRQYDAASSMSSADILNAASLALIAQQYADDAYSSARSDVQSYESSVSYSSHSSGGSYDSPSSSSSGSWGSSSSSSGSWNSSSGGSFGGGGGSSGGSW
jgi:uncharacterized membrane protein YgcG